MESALVSLLLLMMVAGVVDFGRGDYARTTLSNAVREAAHLGATNPTEYAGMINAANSTSARMALALVPDLQQSFANNGGVVCCSDRNNARVWPGNIPAVAPPWPRRCPPAWCWAWPPRPSAPSPPPAARASPTTTSPSTGTPGPTTAT